MKTLDSPRKRLTSPLAAPITPSRSTAKFQDVTGKWALLVLLIVCAPLFFLRLGAWGFFDPDEGRYGEIPRAMLESGDYVTPMVNGVNFFDKPPLLYWLIALSYRVLGISEGAARLIPALAALGAVWGAWLLGRRMFGDRAGLMGGVILASCLAWPFMGRIVLTDMLVSSLVFLALAFWWMGRSETADAKAQRWSFFAFWTALALGVLAKGPIAIVLTGGSIAMFLLLSKEREVLRRMNWKTGLLWGLVVTAPWFVIVAIRNPEFNKAFWFDQHLGRFTGQLAERDHDNGPFYFLEFLPLLFFPWTVFAPAAMAAGWQKFRAKRGTALTEKERALLFLVCSGVFMTLFFSASQCKLVTYIMPVMPLMAVALGGYFAWVLERPERWNRALRNGGNILAGALIVGGVVGFAVGPHQLEKVEAPTGLAWVLGTTFIVWGITLVWSARQFRLPGVVTATAGGFCLFFGLATGVVQEMARTMTMPRLIEPIRPGLNDQSEIVSLGLIQSLS